MNTYYIGCAFLSTLSVALAETGNNYYSNAPYPPVDAPYPAASGPYPPESAPYPAAYPTGLDGSGLIGGGPVGGSSFGGPIGGPVGGPIGGPGPVGPIGGPGPIGSFGGPGPIGAFGGGPGSYGSFPPYAGGPFSPYSLTAKCAKFELFKSYFLSAFWYLQPILSAVLGIVVFFAFKMLFLPHIGVIAKALDNTSYARSGDQDRQFNTLTSVVLRAISKGVCVEKIACHMGLRAKPFTITKAVVRAIEDSSSEPEKLISIFKSAASGKEENCKRYICKNTVDEKSQEVRKLESNLNTDQKLETSNLTVDD